MPVEYKTIADSITEQIQIIMPEHINGYGRLFGGKLMEWIDVVAAVVARRHCNCNVTTVSVDHLHFKEAVHVNDTIVLIGQVSYVGRTSMEIQVETFVEALNGQKSLVNTAYLIMVAIDDNEQPVVVPKILLQNEEEEKKWEQARQRREIRKQRYSQ